MAGKEDLWVQSGFDPRHLGDVEKCDLPLRRTLLLSRLTTGQSFKVLERQANVPALFGYDRRGFVAQTVFRYYGLVEQDRNYWRQQPVTQVEMFVDQLLDDTELPSLRRSLAAVETTKKSDLALRGIEDLVTHMRRIPPERTETATSQKARIYMETFRLLLLKLYRGCCALCETREESQLRVSHLAPWAKKPAWRLEPQNAILACRAHDGLIDAGLITLADDYSLIASPFLNLDQNTALLHPIQAASFRAPVGYAPSAECLAYHRAHVFRAPRKKVAAASIKNRAKRSKRSKSKP